ncbi:MAG: sensor histidine kinase [Candidatus Promineifilaceae bacterium]
MNRLWVRISLVVAGVAIFIALFPLATRNLWFPPERFNRPIIGALPPDQLDRIPSEQLARIQQRAGERAWQRLWVGVAISAGIGLGAGIWLSRSLSKPLAELEKGAREVAAHNLSYRVPEKGSQEMRTVARAFNAMAAEMDRAQTQQRNMLADITHELRHPVHVLRGNLQAIMDGVFDLEMGEIAFLAEQTQHLSELVDDLHELALAEADELPLHKHETDLSSLMDDAVEAVQPLAANKDITLSIHRTPPPLWLEVDERRIRQTLLNLLSNSIRHTPEGGRVALSLEERGSWVTIEVTDTGSGIAAEDLPYVFDRFYRSDSSRSREQGGTGLGLAIVKAIVEAHGGRVDAASPGPGLGSTFTIYLPES